MTISRRELSVVLRQLAKLHTEAHRLRAMVSKYSVDRYGVDPSDVDNDEFIDAVDGGNGACPGMTAQEFDESMERALSR